MDRKNQVKPRDDDELTQLMSTVQSIIDQEKEKTTEFILTDEKISIMTAAGLITKNEKNKQYIQN